MIKITQVFKKISWKAWGIAFLILLGAYARFVDLAWHFSHADDIGVAKFIIDEKLSPQYGVFVIPRLSTYAPFQFFFTHFLLSPEHTYRELLFWGRLPSAVFGVLGLLAMAFFYRVYEAKNSWAAFSGLGLLAFSWENIIYAKQMSNYALGVTACILLLLLYMDCLNRPCFSLKKMWITGLLLALLCHMHYQILFFVPAFYLSLFVFAASKRRYYLILARNFAAGGVVCLAAISPMIYFFVSKRLSAGIVSWNRGPNDEFIFLFREGMTLGDKIGYAIGFYLKNFFLVFQANTAILPENNGFSPFVSGFFFLLFLSGMVGYLVTSDVKKRYLGLFLGVLLAEWFLLVFYNKITLSPTRHSLILLPLMCVACSDGLSFFSDKIKNSRFVLRPGAFSHQAVALFTVIVFFSFFPKVVAERRDPFVEREIIHALKQYKVDTVFPTNSTVSVSLMKSVQKYFKYFELGFMGYEVISDGPQPYNVVAWVSRQDKLTSLKFEEVRLKVNEYLKIRNWVRLFQKKPPLPFWTRAYSDYQVLYSQEKVSNVEIEFSDRTRYGRNDFYFYILRRREKS